MKPLQLTVRGFTAFRHEAVIDFRGRGLFVITGPTGAGKSSLLDAMTWALYGRVPRVGPEVRHLLAHGEQQMSVLFEFSVRGRQYRVARRHPGGTSTRLEVLTGGRWVPEADRARDVLHRVESILGMNYETFTRVILLPQGQFDAFLRGDTADRRKLLSELLGLDVYQRAGELARELVKDRRARADTILAQLPRLAGATPEAIAARREELGTLEARLVAAEQHRIALDTVQQRWGDAETMRARSDQATTEAQAAAAQATNAEDRHARSRKALAHVTAEVNRLLAERTALAYDREAHQDLRAQVLLLDQRLQAEAALATARADLDRARTSEQTAGQTRAQDVVALASARQVLDEAGMVLAARTADLTAAAGHGHQLSQALDAELARLEEQAARAESSARASDQRARELATLAAAIDEAERSLAGAVTALAGAEQALAEHAEAHARAVGARARAEKAQRAAQAGLAQARREHAAADLRMGLQAGDPCPVCGEPIAAIDHAPAPDLVRAEQALDAAERALANARHAAEATATAQAASEARRDEAAARMAAVRSQLDGLAQQAAAFALTTDAVATDAVATDAVAAAAAAAERQVAEHGAQAAGHRAAAATGERQRRALLDALGRVPDTVEPKAAPGATGSAGDPLAVARALGDALEAYGAARDSFSRADAAVREATTSATVSASAADGAASAVEQAEKALDAAAARLDSLGGVGGDPQAIRAALTQADTLARLANELDEALRTAREGAASAETAAAAAQTALEAARAAAEHREAERRAAATARTKAERALAEVWRQAIGGGDQSAAVLRNAVAAARAQEQAITTGIGSTRTALAQLERQLEDAEALRHEAAQHQARADLVSRVANDLRGDRFVAFLLQESMQQLAADSSHYLGQFTDGRYRLVAEDGEFRVIDHLNADEQRSVKTLSGGETFLASLALALALSERLPELAGTGGAVSLDSLFLDEGFGALDPESLDLAVQGLESLASGQRMIGVISHVAELADRVPDRIRVEKTAAGSIITD